MAAGSGLRVADAVEGGTVRLPADLTALTLAELVATSRSGPPHTYAHAQEAFQDFAADLNA